MTGIGPAIGAGTSLFGGLFGRPRDPSSQEQGLFRQGQGAAGQLFRSGQNLFGQGQQLLQGATQFLTPLLFGDRAAGAAATAPERGAITDVFRGARRNIREETRGGVRDLALAMTAQREAGQKGNLFANLRRGAAETAGRLGLGAAAGGLQGQAAGASIFAQLAQAIQSGRLDASQLDALFSAINRQTGEDIGGGIFELLRGLGSGDPQDLAGSFTSRRRTDTARPS